MRKQTESFEKDSILSQKEENKQNKGITLIALVITIIVLLILAGVTINTVSENGIIENAKDARGEYTKAQTNEQESLEYYEAYIEKSVGKWIQKGSKIKRINEDGTVTTLKIGDYVNYQEGTEKYTPIVKNGTGTSVKEAGSSIPYVLETSEVSTENLNWRLLGVNSKGQLELISSNPTEGVLYIANDIGYINTENNLNDFCYNLYGKGEYANRARSLNVDDINKLTNYKPTEYKGYGVKSKFFFSDTNTTVQYQVFENNKWSDAVDSQCKNFRIPGETEVIGIDGVVGSKEITTTHYEYDISDNITIDDGFSSEEATIISNMITKGTEEEFGDKTKQWLASKYVSIEGSNRKTCGFWN